MSNKIKVLDHGFVELLEVHGSEKTIVRAARQCYGKFDDELTPQDTRRIIRMLTYRGHTTPFELAAVHLRVKVPLMVWAQWKRHRTATIQEKSFRYTSPEMVEYDNTWCTPGLTEQDLLNNKTLYKRLLKSKPKEVARKVLFQSVYTEAIWHIDLHNLRNFLTQRTDSHAQREIRQYAEAIRDLAEPHFPNVIEAWEDYLVGSLPYLVRFASNDLIETLDEAGLSVPVNEPLARENLEEFGWFRELPKGEQNYIVKQLKLLGLVTSE